MSIWHLIILLVILLLIFGPSRLEGIGTALGRAVHGFKKGMEGGGELPDEKASNKDNTVKKDDSIK